MIEKILPLLGFARRAGRLSLGHDAVIQSVVKNRAKLCLASESASSRLRGELEHACAYNGKNIPFFVLPCGMEELSKAVGQKVSVVSVDDEGFAAAIQKHIQKG